MIPSIGGAPRSDKRFPEPIPGESLPGWLTRAARGRSMPRMWALTAELGVDYLGKPGALTGGTISVDRIAGCLKAAPEQIEARMLLPCGQRGFGMLAGVRVRTADVVTQTRRFPPSRLREVGTHLAVWSLRTLPFCATTWEYMVDRCGRCRRVQRWKATINVQRCDGCGFLLSATPAEQVAVGLRSSLRAVASLVDASIASGAKTAPPLPPPLSGLNAGAAFETVVQLARILDPGLPLDEPALVVPRLQRLLADGLARSWDLLQGWPSSFSLAMADGRASAISSDRLRSSLSPNSPRPLLPETAALLAAPFNEPDRLLGTKQTARALGATETQVAEARSEGCFEATLCIRTGRIGWGLKRKEIGRLASERRQRIGRHRAAVELALPIYGLDQLLNESILPLRRHMWFDRHYGGAIIVAADLSDLKQRIVAGATMDREACIQIGLAMRGWGGGPKPWSTVFSMLLDGRLRHAADLGQDGKLAISIAPEAIGLIRSMAPGMGPGEYVQKDALEMLNASRHVNQHLAQLRGSATSTGRSWLIPKEVLEPLAATVITAPEVMARSGLAEKTVRRMLQESGCEPAHPFGWRRADVHRLVPELFR